MRGAVMRASGSSRGPMLPLVEAQRRIAQLPVATKVESVALEAALGRVLSEAPASDLDLPPFDRATMDGYAVRAADAAGSAALSCLGTLAAGASASRELP